MTNDGVVCFTKRALVTIPSLKNTQNAELSVGVGLFHKTSGARFSREDEDFSRFSPFSLSVSSLRMFQNFHLTDRAFLAYTKIQAVLQSKNHFFNVGYFSLQHKT